MQRQRTIKVKQDLTTGGLALAESPAGPTAATAFNVPAAFRQQERFWKEVRRRIAERRPAAAGSPDRLY